MPRSSAAGYFTNPELSKFFPSPLTGEGSGEGEHRSSPSPSLLPPREEKYVGEFLLEKERS